MPIVDVVEATAASAASAAAASAASATASAASATAAISVKGGNAGKTPTQKRLLCKTWPASWSRRTRCVERPLHRPGAHTRVPSILPCPCARRYSSRGSQGQLAGMQISLLDRSNGALWPELRARLWTLAIPLDHPTWPDALVCMRCALGGPALRLVWTCAAKVV